MTAAEALATVLIVDTVGSTARRSSMGEDRADRAEAAVTRMLCDAVERNGGRVAQHRGDGVMALFPSATLGVTAAVEMQQAAARARLVPNPSVDRGAGAELRVGLSVGDISFHDGLPAGIPIVEAARLEAAAAPGQILCTDHVVAMSRGRGGHRFEAAGFFELKGLPEPIPVAAVRWEVRAGSDGPPLPPELRGGSRRFVGRAVQLARLRGLLERTDGPHVAWLLGEPGIGKTRLAAEAAGAAHERGALVLFGRESEDLDVPLQSFAEALAAHIAELVDDRLADAFGPEAAELARLAPELAARLGVPSVYGGDRSSDAERHRLFQAVRAWLARAAADRPVVLVLDDLHWAGDATQALLRHLARRPVDAPLVIIATARDTHPDTDEALSALIDDLEATGRSHRILVRGLALEEIVDLAADEGVGARIHEQTAGNALFVDVLLQAEDGSAAEPDEDLHGVVRRRVGRLRPGVHDLLSMTAVSGLDVDVPVLASAMGREEIDLLEDLDLAVRAGLLVEVSATRVRWIHALVRDAIASELGPARRTHLHARLAAALERHRGVAVPAEVARHYWEARDVAGAEPAFRWSLEAAVRAIEVRAFHEAADQYDRCWVLADAVGLDIPAKADLARQRGDALSHASRFDEAADWFRRSFELAAAAGDGERELLAATAQADNGWRPGFDGGPAVSMLARALADAAGERPDLEAIGLSSLGRALDYAGRPADALAATRRAIALARETGDRMILVRALSSHMSPLTDLTRLGADSEAALAIREAASLLDEDDDPDVVLHVTNLLAWAAIQASDRALWDRTTARYLDVAERDGQSFWTAMGLMMRFLDALADGRLEDADRAVDAYESAVDGFVGANSSGSVLRFVVRREQGRLREVLPVVRLVLRTGASAAVWRPGLVALLAELGFAEEAAPEVSALVADDFRALPADATRLMCMCLLADAVIALDDRVHAPEVYEALRVMAGQPLVWQGVGVALGAADRYLGRLAALRGWDEQADAHFAAALDLEQAMRWPLWEARTSAAWGRSLLRRRPAQAADLLARARAIAEPRGLHGVVAELDAVEAARS